MKNLILTLIIFANLTVFGQQHKSIHQLEQEKYDSIGYSTDAQWDTYNHFKKMNIPQTKGCKLNKVVFGWHPYWGGSKYLNYQWSYLSDLAYFSYDVDYTDGSAASTHGWESAAVVDTALANGVRVHLTATLFGNHDDFFANATAQQNLIDNLITAVISRNATGINIDFEGMDSDNKNDFTTFIQNLSTSFKSQVPDGLISICLYAVDWSNIFDFNNLNNYVDYYTIMGYDYYYSGSSEAGPTGQIYTMNNFNFTQSRTITDYLHNGAPHEKLILGVPYYGMEWKTQSDAIPSNSTGYVSSRTIAYIKDNASGDYSNSVIDSNSLSKCYIFNDGTDWHQAWVDDADNLKYSYKMLNQQGIGGIGIWALGYDDGYTEMWDLIRDYFSECAEVPLTDTFWDLGGPTRNHFNHEDFVYTIKPTRGTSLTLTFNDFELENNYDSLYIYDGKDTNSTLIGGFSGTNSPGAITATGNALTLKFHSDGGTTKSGWTAIWNSNADNQQPTTSIASTNWTSTNFYANFTDSDNLNIKYKFYQVTDFNETSWLSNSNYGFLNDNFNQPSINNQWTQSTGTWSINNNKLHQSDDNLSNTNIYANLVQDTSATYLYQWKMKLSGTDGNRRGGLHFFCDDATQSNRNNNYMVYFRADQNTVQFYRYIDNNYNLKAETTCNINPDEFYNYSITYNPKTGEIKAFQNDTFLLNWIDPNQITSGNSVSLRIGNAIADIDDFQVFKSRSNTENITTGSGNYEVRYENTDSATSACNISSIILDVNDNFSTIATKSVNIDFSAPSTISNLNDGLANDEDTTFAISQLSANWTSATDSNSGIAAYWYAVGSQPLDSNICNWTRINNDTNTTILGLNLQYDSIYYVSVKAENLAGLIGSATSSDGIRVVLAQQPPTANFASNDSSICSGDSVTFYYTGLNAQNFSWIFEGTNSDTIHSMNPTIKYDTAGKFNVTLIVTNDIGSDTLTTNNYITINQTPTVNFEATPLTGDLPLVVNFTNNSTDTASSYFWNFGDGNTFQSNDFQDVIQHLFATSGSFNVSLTVQNSNQCSSTLSKENYITVNTISSITENNNNFKIYPNPVTNYLSIKNVNNNFKYTITDLTGRTLQKGENQTQINVSNFKSGNYILLVETSNKLIYRQFIKK